MNTKQQPLNYSNEVYITQIKANAHDTCEVSKVTHRDMVSK